MYESNDGKMGAIDMIHQQNLYHMDNHTHQQSDTSPTMSV